MQLAAILLIFSSLFFSEKSFAEIDCSAEYTKLVKKLKTSPQNFLKNRREKPLEASEFDDLMENMTNVRNCGKLKDIDNKSLTRFFALSLANLDLEYAERKALAGIDPTPNLEEALSNKKYFTSEQTRFVDSIRKIYEAKKDSFKNACTKKDLRETKNGHMLLDSPLQHELSWCYAFSAATMIGFKTGMNVSTTDLGFLSKMDTKFEPKLLKEGGFTWQVIDLVQKHGFCEESKQASSIPDQSLFKLYTEIMSPDNSCTDISIAFKGAGNLSPDLLSKLKNLKNVLPIMNRIACSQRIPFDRESTLTKTNLQSVDETFGQWNDLLNSDEIFAITYNPAIFWDGNIISKSNLNPKTYHSSVVIARRFNEAKGVCEFLVRDSYKRNDGKISDDHEVEGTQSIWISAVDLIKATKETIYFAPTNK